MIDDEYDLGCTACTAGIPYIRPGYHKTPEDGVGLFCGLFSSLTGLRSVLKDIMEDADGVLKRSGGFREGHETDAVASAAEVAGFRARAREGLDHFHYLASSVRELRAEKMNRARDEMRDLLREIRAFSTDDQYDARIDAALGDAPGRALRDFPGSR